MSAARDEAIKAMRERLYTVTFDDEPLDVILDAIPPAVLAQLAIEAGGLVPSTLDQTGTLYRVADR